MMMMGTDKGWCVQGRPSRCLMAGVMACVVVRYVRLCISNYVYIERGLLVSCFGCGKAGGLKEGGVGLTPIAHS